MVLDHEPYLPNEVPQIQPLVQIEGSIELAREGISHYEAFCRDCGALLPVAKPQSLIQAGLVRDRHLAEHLEALATEIKEAAR